MSNGSDSTGLEVTRRHLLHLAGGLALLVGYRPVVAQQPMKPLMDGNTTMKIERNGSRPSTKGLQDYFSGSVRVEPVFQVGEPMRLNAGSVTFEPGARTAWHTHPLGQTLIITAGLGWVQTEGGQIDEVRPGDVVWFPPGEKHWHGATPTTAMTHIAVQESLNGKNVDWMEKVSDAQYIK
jgi:quercetin dioxygenase-like cupin family protein